MTKFLTTQGASYYIEDIIRNAEDELVLISPFLQLSKTLFERLQDADKRNVKIYLIYGKDELKPEAREQLGQLENLELYFFQNLHAKCYFNAENMVITSMNMYDFSEKTNREMGVLISKKDDGNLFYDAVKEAKSIKDSATKEKLNRPQGKPYSDRTKQTGYCIRCGASIKRDSEKPLCSNCFSAWVEWANPDYEEEFCHWCGKSAATTINKPLCYSCYNKSVR